jgi:hypothetical protein
VKRRELEAEVARLREEADRVRSVGHIWSFLRGAGEVVLMVAIYAMGAVLMCMGVLGLLLGVALPVVVLSVDVFNAVF